MTTTAIDIRREIILILLQHQGKARAITGKALAQRFGHKDDREVRLIIRDLISSGYPIASSTGKPQGYFIIETHGEALEYMKELRSRLIENAIRRRDFKHSVNRYLQKEVQKRML